MCRLSSLGLLKGSQTSLCCYCVTFNSKTSRLEEDQVESTRCADRFQESCFVDVPGSVSPTSGKGQ